MKSLSTTKSKISYLILFAIWLLAFFTYGSIDFSDSGTMLFHNGNIITMEKEHQYPEAVYIEDGIIKSIGKYELLRTKINSSTQIIDLDGKTLMPGFIDSHTHPVISSFLHDMIDLSGFTHTAKEHVWNHLSNRVLEYNPGDWILCKGFDQVLVPGLTPPHISYLDSIAPDNPLLIVSQNLHSYLGQFISFP